MRSHFFITNAVVLVGIGLFSPVAGVAAVVIPPGGFLSSLVDPASAHAWTCFQLCPPFLFFGARGKGVGVVELLAFRLLRPEFHSDFQSILDYALPIVCRGPLAGGTIAVVVAVGR
jgi:hypothetical protein